MTRIEKHLRKRIRTILACEIAKTVRTRGAVERHEIEDDIALACKTVCQDIQNIIAIIEEDLISEFAGGSDEVK